MKFRLSLVALLIVLLSLFFTGLDLTHHAHNSWLYYQMIRDWNYQGINPYFESQITYAYGVPAYALAGLLWFLFSIHSITILQAITIIVNYIILVKWFKKDYWVTTLILMNIFFTIFDSYPSQFSNCLFWLASYAFYKKKVWWPVPLLIAAANHPYVLISSILFAIKVPALIIPESLILTYFLLATRIFTSNLYLPIYTVFMGLSRIVINILPILVLTSNGEINIKDLKILRDISNVKLKMPTLLTTLLFVGLAIVVLTIYTLVMQPQNAVDFTMFEGIPIVNGTVRVVDYLYLPSVYVLPYYGFVLEAGSFRENNPQHLVKTFWENKSQYEEFINSKDLSYVLFCRMCNPQSNEKDVLDTYYSLVWENEYYYLYSLS